MEDQSEKQTNNKKNNSVLHLCNFTSNAVEHSSQMGGNVTNNNGLLVAQLVENLPAMWETWVPTLGWEDPLEKGKATHSSILAWRIL